MKTQTIESAIFPTRDDELVGSGHYTCYIPIGSNIHELIDEADEPYNLEIDIASHRELHPAEIKRIKGKVNDHIASYYGELDLKKRFRTNALRRPSIVEILLLLGMGIGCFVPFYGWFMTLNRLVLSTIVFWLLLIFIRTTIGPWIGGLKYSGLQKKVERWRKLRQDIIITVDTSRNYGMEEIHLNFGTRDHDTVDLYKVLHETAKLYNPPYELAAKFYDELPKRQSPNGSFITVYLPARWRDNMKTIFDVSIRLTNILIPIGVFE